MILEDLTPLVLVHFVFQRGMEFMRDGDVLYQQPAWGIACAPNLGSLHALDGRGNWQRSDDPRAVTCPMCKDTPVFVEAMGRTPVIKRKR